MNITKEFSSIKNDLSEIKILLTKQSSIKKSKEILSAQEVMDLLKINRSTFSKWRSSNFIKVYSINRRLYCKYSEILEALENGIIEQKKQ